MNGSILTNQGAMVALQTMKSINKSLSGVQDMISTGKRVATSKDNAAIWAISSVMESDVSSFKAVTDSLALGQSTVSVARNAAEQVKDSLIEIKSKIIAAQEENVDREKIQADVDAIRSQIKSIVGASQFNGLNLLKSSEDLKVLSSLDRSSNGSTTTSTINIEAKSLDSGTTAASTAGTAVVEAVNTTATVTAAFVTNANPATVTDGVGTLGTFTNSTQDFTFSTTEALDEGDSVSFSFTDGTNTATFTYTQTAVGTAQTTGEELAKQLKDAYTAFAARDADGAGVNIGTGANVGDYDATTKTYTAAEGTFVVTGTGADNLNTLEMSEVAGTLTVVNTRDTGVIFTLGTEQDRLTSDVGDDAAATVADGNTGSVVLAGTIGLQQDDTYDFYLRDNSATTTDVEELKVSITGAELTKAQVASLGASAFEAFKAGSINSFNTTAGAISGTTLVGTTTAGVYTDSVTGASITIDYDADSTTLGNADGINETQFRQKLDGTSGTVTFGNATSGQVDFTNDTGFNLEIQGDFTEGSVDTVANIAVSNTSNLSELVASSQDFAFTTTVPLEEGDSVDFTFSNGIDSMVITYEQTAGGNAQTTGEELSAQLALAYTAFKAGVNVGTGASAGDFVLSTQTYTGAEGTFTFANGSVGNATDLKNMTFSSTSGVLTVENEGTAAVDFTVGAEVDYVQTDLNANAQTFAIADTGGTAAVTVDFGLITLTGGGATNASGIQADDTYLFRIGESGGGDAATGDTTIDGDEASIAFSITGAALSKAELADTIQRISAAYIAGDITSTSNTYTGGDTEITYAGSAGQFNINGATVSLTFTQGTGSIESTFQTDLGTDLTVTNGSSEQVIFTNDSATTTDDYLIQGDLTIGTGPQTAADFAVAGTGTGVIAAATGSTVNNITAGTIGDFLTIDVNNTANQAGDTLSVTIDGVNELDGVAQPINYTATSGQTESDIATGFAAAINTALNDAGIRDIVAKTRTGGLIDIKNYNITTTKEVSDLQAVNELTNAARAVDSNGADASTIAAGATNEVRLAANKPSEGDTYSITVGNTAVSYTARNGDTLNDVGSNLSGLLKINTSDDLTVSFTNVDNPETTDGTITIKNNGTTAITAFSATVKGGGTAGGGLELLDDIDVTTSSKAEGSLDLIESLIEVAIDAASSYGSSEKRLESQQSFISKLTDSLKSGIGSLVDANLEETSARLQALQVQQQLGTQALSIANQAPQSILSLFR